MPVLSTDAISSGDDEDDTERSDDVGADGEQMREYQALGGTPVESHIKGSLLTFKTLCNVTQEFHRRNGFSLS